jgi:hypothetical protein
MSTTTASEQAAPPTYGHWRRPRSAGLLGLGKIGTAAGLGAVVLVLIAAMVSWKAALILLAVFLAAFAPLLLRVGGRTGAQAATARISWWRGRRARQHVYRAGAISAIPGGAHTLPGLLAASQMFTARDAYDREFGLIHIPATGHYTAVLRADADGAALVDASQVDEWVAGWAAWLASLAHEPALEAVSVTVETAPDSGQRLRTEVGTLIDPAAPELARQVLSETAQLYPAGSAQVATRVALTYRAAHGGQRRDPAQMAVEIGSRLPALAESLASAGAGAARPMTPSALAEAVFTAYHPTQGVDVDQAHADGDGTGIDWADAGPSGMHEGWDRLRHDCGLSVSWAMEEAPRGAVLSSVLTSLLSPHPDTPRKRVTLVYRPHDPAAAARIVDADLRDARFLESRRPVAKARDSREVRAALQSTQEEAAGAGVIRFSLLVTATVTDDADYRQATTAVGNLAATARLRLRRLHGAQSAAFSAGLGLGVVLPSHVLVPTTLREEL